MNNDDEAEAENEVEDEDEDEAEDDSGGSKRCVLRSMYFIYTLTLLICVRSYHPCKKIGLFPN